MSQEGDNEQTYDSIEIEDNQTRPPVKELPWLDTVYAVSYTHLTLPTICSV